MGGLHDCLIVGVLPGVRKEFSDIVVVAVGALWLWRHFCASVGAHALLLEMGLFPKNYFQWQIEKCQQQGIQKICE